MNKKIPQFNINKTIFSYKYLEQELNFRYISLADIKNIQKLLQKNARIFSVDTLYNQIENKSEFNSRELKKFISLNLGDLIKKYLEKNSFVKKHYEKSKLKSIPEKFKDSFKIYFDEQLVSMKIFTDNITNQVNQIIKPLFPQFNALRGIAKMYSSILEPFHKNFEGLSKIISQIKIDNKKCFRKLKKYSWIITPEMPITTINLISEVKNAKEINTIFEAYYFENNFEELNNCLSRWSKNDLFKKRMKIFRDAFGTIKELDKNPKINYKIVVIPVLINQIEGIREAYLISQKNLPKNRNIFYYLI